MKKLSVILLLSAILLSGCSNDNSAANDATADTTTAQTETAETTTAQLTADLPEYDGEGAEFVMLNVDPEQFFWNYHTLVPEAENGEVLNDAIYGRTRTVEEQFNVKFVETNITDTAGALTKSVSAGDSDYDCAFMGLEKMSMIVPDYVLEISNIPYIDLDKPWWYSDANESLSIAHKMFCLTGAISMTYDNAVMPLTMNMTMVENYGFDSPYDKVRSGEWTLDYIGELVSAVTQDLDGDGTLNVDTDSVGMVGEPDEFYAVIIGANENIVKKDDKDIPYLAYGEEKINAIYDKAHQLLSDGFGHVYNTAKIKYTQGADSFSNAFKEDRALFFLDLIFWISDMRNMESDFAILPQPKFEESQDTYYSYQHSSSCPVYIPKTNPDLERTGILLEALAAESYYTIKPAFYEVVLSQKYLRDADSIEMLDILFAHKRCELQKIYDWNGIHAKFCKAISDGTALATLNAAEGEAIQNKINDIVQSYIDAE